MRISLLLFLSTPRCLKRDSRSRVRHDSGGSIQETGVRCGVGALGVLPARVSAPPGGQGQLQGGGHGPGRELPQPRPEALPQRQNRRRPFPRGEADQPSFHGGMEAPRSGGAKEPRADTPDEEASPQAQYGAEAQAEKISLLDTRTRGGLRLQAGALLADAQEAPYAKAVPSSRGEVPPEDRTARFERLRPPEKAGEDVGFMEGGDR